MSLKDEPKSPGFEDDVSLSPNSPIKADDEDEDKYEDALDLDTSQSHSKVWLVRMPKFLMDQWQDEDYFSGKTLGKVRIRQAPPGTEQPWKVRLVLDDTPRTHDLPHNYDLTLVHQIVDNTYVFKETEIPKEVRPKNVVTASTAPSDDYRDYTPIVRNVPKKTALIGQACHECVVNPDFRDPNYRHIIAKRKLLEQSQPDRQVTLLEDTAGVGGLKYGASMRSQGNLLKQQTKRDLYKNGDGKAIRMPKDELLDKLFKLFEDYEYWTLKGLKERTRQPEVYLKEVLDQIAILNKKGPYAMKYGLRQEFKQLKNTGTFNAQMANARANSAVKDESPPAPSQSHEENDDEDDDMIDII